MSLSTLLKHCPSISSLDFFLSHCLFNLYVLLLVVIQRLFISGFIVLCSFRLCNCLNAYEMFAANVELSLCVRGECKSRRFVPLCTSFSFMFFEYMYPFKSLFISKNSQIAFFFSSCSRYRAFPFATYAPWSGKILNRGNLRLTLFVNFLRKCFPCRRWKTTGKLVKLSLSLPTFLVPKMQDVNSLFVHVM